MLATIAGASAAGLVGGVAGGLVGVGVSETDARGYQDRLKHGGRLLSVLPRCSTSAR